MIYQDLDEAIREAERFLIRAKAAKKLPPSYTGSQHIEPGKLVADVKRSSMDLSNALVRLRKY